MPKRRVGAVRKLPTPDASADNEAKSAPPPIAELLIFDVIGRDFWSGEGVTATDVVNFLAEQDEDAEIHVRINSPGGSAFDGTAIYNALARDPRQVVIHIDGLAASAASLVAMAGDEIRMAENALLMIHGASGLTIGTAVDHEDMAAMLHKVDNALAGTYSARTGAKRDDVETWMNEETWMSSDEALDRGFADVIDAAKNVEASWGRYGQQVVASFRKSAQHISKVPQARPQQIAAQAVKELPMDPTKICAALGLPEDAQHETIMTAIEARTDALEKLTADAAASKDTEPDPRRYASREDLDQVRARAEQLETQLRDRDLEELLRAAEGKLVFSDSDRDRYRKFVREGGMTLATLREEIDSKPKSPLATADEVTARKPALDEHGLDAGDLAFCAQYGLNPEVFAKNKAKRGDLKVV